MNLRRLDRTWLTNHRITAKLGLALNRFQTHDAVPFCGFLRRDFPGMAVDHFDAHADHAVGVACCVERVVQTLPRAWAHAAARAGNIAVCLCRRCNCAHRALRTQVSPERVGGFVFERDHFHVHHRIGESGVHQHIADVVQIGVAMQARGSRGQRFRHRALQFAQGVGARGCEHEHTIGFECAIPFGEERG
jgi:hypothetical protein